jgi:hypothetical protein
MISGHGVMPNQQNEVSSCRIACILDNTTVCLSLDRFIHSEVGDIVHEGRHRRDLVIVDNVFVVPLVVQCGKHESL